ncbi:MAG: alpha-ketoglutarate-dependent dioxygenase AlkB [Thermoleophilia bacterium]|nr:alpha-ketoglutarate-dependent dioxygenase AlkB [Thermoleophilia bacterium]
MDQLFESEPERAKGEPVEIAPGAVHVPGWLSLEEQRKLVESCRQWAQGPTPMRHPKVGRGGQMSVKMVSLGWHWLPYRYSRTADDLDGQEILPFPDWLKEMAKRGVADAHGDQAAADAYEPDAALINFYDEVAKMGLHQDKDEQSDAPVVSLSLGDTCVFRFGNTENRNKPWTDIELKSGDLFVFGGDSRYAFHGVTKLRPGTASPQCGLTGGRLNLTIRETGLT